MPQATKPIPERVKGADFPLLFFVSVYVNITAAVVPVPRVQNTDTTVSATPCKRAPLARNASPAAHTS